MTIESKDQMKWIDMSSAGIYLFPQTLANQKKVVLLLDCNNILEPNNLSVYGFERIIIENQPQISQRLYMRDKSSGYIQPNIFVKVGVPHQLIRIIAATEEFLTEQFNTQLLRFTNYSLNQLLNTKTKLGRNNLGDMVYGSPFGRFAENEETGAISVEKRDASGGIVSDPRFLRAKLRGEVYSCVTGFLDYQVELKNNISNADLIHFTALITQKGNASFDLSQVTSTQLDIVQDALEMAVVAKYADLDLNNKDHFDLTVQIFDQLPIRNISNNVVLSLQQITTPLPLAFIAQRLLVDQDQLENNDQQFSILEPCLGHASLVSMLTQFKNLDIFGFDIDNHRLSRLQKTELMKSLQVFSGDSQVMQFKEYNGSDCFDFVISNLPCDRINKTNIGKLLSHPQEILSTARLDYFLLHHSLKNRKDDGRSVYLFSTDAPISHGKIKSSTHLMLCYLHENYHVEDFIELSGELYARQGAKYNIRILVVGNKRETPITDRDLLNKSIDTQLKFFTNYQDLWLWSNRIIEKRFGDEEFDLTNAKEVNIYGDAQTNNNFNEKYLQDFGDNQSLEQISSIAPIASVDQREINANDDSTLQNIMGNNEQVDQEDTVVEQQKTVPDVFLDNNFDSDEDLLADKDDETHSFASTISSRETVFDSLENKVVEQNTGNAFFDNNDDKPTETQGIPLSQLDDDFDPSQLDDDFDPSQLDDDFDPSQLDDEELSDSVENVTITTSHTGPSKTLSPTVTSDDKPEPTTQPTSLDGSSHVVIEPNFDTKSTSTEEPIAPKEEVAAPVFGFDDADVDLDSLETTEATDEVDGEVPDTELFTQSDDDFSQNDADTTVTSETETTTGSAESDSSSEDTESQASVETDLSSIIEPNNEIVRVAGNTNKPSSTIIKSLDDAVLYEENNYQQKYIAESQVSETISMIPKNLAPSFYRARDALVEYLELSTQVEIEETLTDATGTERIFVGSNRFYDKDFTEYAARTNFRSMIDTYVGYMLQYETHEELAECFACEQVDAIALAISQHKSNRAIWIGDQTGLGKGRVAAGLLRYAKLQGLRPAFFTLNAQLFGDIWRDITAIKADKLFSNPFIFNANASISEFGTSTELFKGTNIPKEMLTISKDHDLILATYSQFGKPGVKPTLLIDAVDENTFLVLDESHKAAGEKSHINKIFTEIIGNASSLAYSSATGIKTANNLPFYYRLFPASISRETILTTLKDADEAVLELVSHNLSMDGCLVRREQDLSKIEFVTPEPNKEYNEYVYQLSDALSAILLEMNELSVSLMDDLNGHFVQSEDPDQFIVNMFKKQHPNAKFNFDDSKLGLKVNMLNFASRLYDIQRQFLLAIKTGSAIETALNCLKNGQKPVISLESTGEAVFNRLMAYKLNTPDENGQTLSDLENEISRLKMQIKHAEENDKSSVKHQKQLDDMVNLRSERIKQYLADFDHPPLFKEILLMMLDSMNKAKISDKDGNYIEIVVGDGNPVYDAQREFIREKINDYPSLAFMPIDIMRNEIRKAGFTIDEIAGTNIRLLQNHETGRWYAESRKSNDIAERVRIVADFQSGKIDALIITRSGSTGISLHALESKNPEIPSDHLRQRVLIMAQLPLEIVEFMQTLGRVDRRGQYSSPQIITLSSCIPAENRINMMHLRKLALLSANTTSNRESRYKETDDMPDMLNEVGNKVCIDYLTENPEIATTFDIDISEDKDKKNEKDKSKYINKLLSKLIMVPIHQQEMIFQDLTAKFNEYVKELEASGRNPLRVQVHNWKAKDVSIHQLKRGALDVSVRNHFGLETAFDHELTYKTVGYSQDMRPIRTHKFAELFKQNEELMLKQLAVILGKESNKVITLSTAILEYADKLDALIVDKFIASCRSSVINAEGEFIVLAGKETARLVQEYFKRDTDPKNPRDLNIKATKQSVRDALEVINNQKLIESFENAQLIIKTLKDLSRAYRSDSEDEPNRHGVVLPMYCPTLDGESAIAGGVLARIHFPPIRTNSLIPSAFKLEMIFPGEDDVVSVSLSYLFAQSMAVVHSCKYLEPSKQAKNVRLEIMDSRAAKDKQREYDEPKQPVYMVYYNIEDKEERLLKSSFDSAHEGRINRTANIVTGNLFKAKTLMDKNVPHCSIIYTNQYGIRERGFLVSPKFTYAALEDSIYRTATTEQIGIYINALKMHQINNEDYPKIQFNARNTSVIIEYQSQAHAIMTLQGASSDINRFLADEQIFKAEILDQPNSLNIVVSGDVIARGARTLRLAKVEWDKLPDLIFLIGNNGHFMTAEISHFHPEPLQTAREQLDKKLNKNFAILSKKHTGGVGSSNRLREVKQVDDKVLDGVVNSVESLFS